MTQEIAGRVVWITGAGSGIGHGLAGAFLRDGARVAATDLPGKLDACAAVGELALACDVTVESQTRETAAEIARQLGALDVLVANAGVGVSARIEEATFEQITSVVDVNLYGVIHCVRAVLPHMRAAGRGRIVAVCSRNAELCPGGLVGYNVSKAAVAAFTRTLSREVSDTDILVNNLIPGPTKTPLNPRGTRPPDAAYPTAKMLATLPEGGPSGKTFFDEAEYPLMQLFVDGVGAPRR